MGERVQLHFTAAPQTRIGNMKASLSHRVVAGLFLITLTGVLGSPCQASDSICVCSGTCPSFTSSWGQTGTKEQTGTGTQVPIYCVAVKSSSSSVDFGPPPVIDGTTYNTPYETCPDQTSAPTHFGDTYAPTTAPTTAPTFPTNAPTSNSATARGSNLAIVAVVAVATMAFQYLA